jgi:pilus assembly protein Flp/PilA
LVVRPGRGKIMLKRFFQDERGATAIEYSLIAALISLAILGGVGIVADGVGNLFTSSAAEIVKATSGK